MSLEQVNCNIGHGDDPPKETAVNCLSLLIEHGTKYIASYQVKNWVLYLSGDALSAWALNALLWTSWRDGGLPGSWLNRLKLGNGRSTEDITIDWTSTGNKGNACRLNAANVHLFWMITSALMTCACR